MFGSVTPDRSGFTVVRRVWSKLQAEIIKGRLETAGVPVLLNYESAGQVIGIIVDGLGEVRIMVPDEYVEEAEALLAEVPGEGIDDSVEDQFQEG